VTSYAGEDLIRRSEQWDLNLAEPDVSTCRFVCLSTVIDASPLRSPGLVFYELTITPRWTGACITDSNNAKWGNGGLVTFF